MHSVINKIFSGVNDEIVHREFVKFSKGIFPSRYLLEAKKQKNQYSVKVGPEFANYLVRACLEKVSGDIAVIGAIIATFDITKEAEFPIERIKQFMGVKQSLISTTTTPEKIISLMDKFPKAFFALSFSTGAFHLKIKAKAPKSAKPASRGDKEATPDFCSLKTNDQSIIDDLFFDAPDFKEVKINHILTIEDIELPKEVKDPVQIRELAIRKGKITRTVIVDGKERKSEASFKA
ncbi:hypothetical protein J4461_00510 [Candidatus Pacearchaeota archaeon]|nr:hypothetical protein [Candidatus Pacearchaeota archaeon]